MSAQIYSHKQIYSHNLNQKPEPDMTTSPQPSQTSQQPVIAEARLDLLTDLFADEMVRVNEVIIEKMGSDVPLIPQLAGHLIAAGGKRLRPLLTLAGAAAGPQKQALPVEAHYLAAAVEFIHNATLLHDDVIDKSEQRRGRQTANAVWGNEASVLVGDFLFARAFELMVETSDLEVLRLLSSASAQITEGEVKQMTLQGAPESARDDYLTVIRNKTAILFAAAAEAGARVGGASEQNRDALHAYGLALGMAFQICDDAIDYVADEAVSGKNCGDDFYERKITLPVILAWEDADETERGFMTRTLADGEFEDGDLSQMQAILDRYDAIPRSLAAARTETEAAITALAGLENQTLSEALAAAARFAAKRAY